jgi:multidrug resistance efflux pump
LLTVVLLIAAGLLGYDMASYYLYSPWTRDARVRANVVTVAPDVSGWVDDIRVRDNQFVHKGTCSSQSIRSAIDSRSLMPKPRSR